MPIRNNPACFFKKTKQTLPRNRCVINLLFWRSALSTSHWLFFIANTSVWLTDAIFNTTLWQLLCRPLMRCTTLQPEMRTPQELKLNLKKNSGLQTQPGWLLCQSSSSLSWLDDSRLSVMLSVMPPDGPSVKVTAESQTRVQRFLTAREQRQTLKTHSDRINFSLKLRTSWLP